MNPETSVIISRNNDASYTDNIYSVNRQRYGAIEIILFHDRSIDKTEAIAIQLPGNIGFFSHEQTGHHAGSRNQGVKDPKDA